MFTSAHQRTIQQLLLFKNIIIHPRTVLAVGHLLFLAEQFQQSPIFLAIWPFNVVASFFFRSKKINIRNSKTKALTLKYFACKLLQPKRELILLEYNYNIINK